MLDVLIRGGMLLRGDGQEPLPGDVGICGDTLCLVGPGQPDTTAHQVIDAAGKCVAPGFIDFHGHSELTLMANPQGQSKLTQGVTTEVVGNCGLTAFPVATDFRRKSLGFMDVPGMCWDWNSLDEYLDRLRGAAPAINVAQLAGHGGIRAAVMGYGNAKASSEELTRMQDMLAAFFDAGLYGVSTGLGYAPDFYSDTDELCALAEVVKTYDRVFAFHIRGERKTLFKAVREVMEVSRRTGANVEVSHLKCADAMNRGRMPEMLKLFDSAWQEGLPVNFDHYPYTAGNAYLGLVFPPWVHAGGMDGLMALLKDATARSKIEREMMEGCGEWSSFIAPYMGGNLVISGIRGQDDWHAQGKSLAQIAREWGCTAPCAACELMLMADGRVDMVMFQQDEEDLMLAMQHPAGMFGSDGFAMDMGELIQKGTPHPRSFGTFPRVLGRYVRERQTITLAEAVRRMTGAPAQKLRLQDRGFLREGMKADVVVFDPETIIDRATYENPFQYAHGVEWVLVNGVIAQTPQGLSRERAGRVLLRKECRE